MRDSSFKMAPTLYDAAILSPSPSLVLYKSMGRGRGLLLRVEIHDQCTAGSDPTSLKWSEMISFLQIMYLCSTIFASDIQSQPFRHFFLGALTEMTANEYSSQKYKVCIHFLCHLSLLVPHKILFSTVKYSTCMAQQVLRNTRLRWLKSTLQ